MVVDIGLCLLGYAPHERRGYAEYEDIAALYAGDVARERYLVRYLHPWELLLVLAVSAYVVYLRLELRPYSNVMLAALLCHYRYRETEASRADADKFTPVLEKLVASSAKNTTTLNLAMENLNSRLDDLEAKFISKQTEKVIPPQIVEEMPVANSEYQPDLPEPEIAPSGNYDKEFADIGNLEIMQDEQKNKDYEDVDIDTLLLRSEDAKK